jgi:hypothetical protein
VIAPVAVRCVLGRHPIAEGDEVRIVPGDFLRSRWLGPLQRLACLTCAAGPKAPVWMRRREEKR